MQKDQEIWTDFDFVLKIINILSEIIKNGKDKNSDSADAVLEKDLFVYYRY